MFAREAIEFGRSRPSRPLPRTKGAAIREKVATESIYSDGSYLATNPTWHVEDSPWKARQVLRMLAQHQLHPQTIAEVGCGAGEILRQLLPALPEASFAGFDISKDAIEIARRRETERLRFFHADICNTPRAFDVLLTMDVVEHVEDCFGFLRAIRDKAEYKIFHIPLDVSLSQLLRNRITYARQNVGHLHYFTKDTALALLRETGYQVLDYFYTPEYEIAPKDPAHKFMAAVRSVSMKVAPNFTAMALGGCPLLVLAR
jgi:SAM-dependent methyltransferase